MAETTNARQAALQLLKATRDLDVTIVAVTLKRTDTQATAAMLNTFASRDDMILAAATILTAASADLRACTCGADHSAQDLAVNVMIARLQSMAGATLDEVRARPH